MLDFDRCSARTAVPMRLTYFGLPSDPLVHRWRLNEIPPMDGRYFVIQFREDRDSEQRKIVDLCRI